jgi:hypothetical protein
MNHCNCSFFFSFNKTKNLGLIAKLSRRKREHKTGNQDYYTKKVQKKKLDATHRSLSHSPSLSPRPLRTCVKRVQWKKYTIKKNRKGGERTQDLSHCERRRRPWEEEPSCEKKLLLALGTCKRRKSAIQAGIVKKMLQTKFLKKTTTTTEARSFSFWWDTETETRESLERKEERRHKMHISRSAMDLQREAYRRAKWKGEQKAGRKAKAGLARR